MKAALLAAFARATGLAEAVLTPTYARLQLWGAAVPLTTTDTPCVFDAGELPASDLATANNHSSQASLSSPATRGPCWGPAADCVPCQWHCLWTCMTLYSKLAVRH